MIREAIKIVVEGENLTRPESIAVMNEIMNGEATPAQVASFLTAMRIKGETVEEITGFVEVMREMAVKVPVCSLCVIDTCGTGGDKLDTFNISTAAAFVAAGAGITVAKHGNRAASSACGSADVLEELGVTLSLSPGRVAACIDQVGIGFIFAPSMHPAMKHAVGPRREIGIRTVFNLLGPMTNPAGAKRQIIGVFSPAYTDVVAEVLLGLGSVRAMVFHGMNGLDEMSTIGETRVSEIADGRVFSYTVQPSTYGLIQAEPGHLKAGDGSVRANAKALREVLDGNPGPKRDIVLLNAAAAIVVAEKASDIREGISIATRSVDSGAAASKLDQLIALTKEFSEN